MLTKQLGVLVLSDWTIRIVRLRRSAENGTRFPDCSGRKRLESKKVIVLTSTVFSYSVTGKKLMAKCRMLIQENQELGRQLSQGRVAQLEAELALQKKYSDELKGSQDGKHNRKINFVVICWRLFLVLRRGGTSLFELNLGVSLDTV